MNVLRDSETHLSEVVTCNQALALILNMSFTEAGEKCLQKINPNAGYEKRQLQDQGGGGATWVNHLIKLEESQ